MNLKTGVPKDHCPPILLNKMFVLVDNKMAIVFCFLTVPLCMTEHNSPQTLTSSSQFFKGGYRNNVAPMPEGSTQLTMSEARRVQHRQVAPVLALMKGGKDQLDLAASQAE